MLCSKYIIQFLPHARVKRPTTLNNLAVALLFHGEI